MGATQAVYAATLKPPSLLEPSKNDTFQIKKPIVFRWQKSTGATKYRLIISSNPTFGNYEPKNVGKCTTTFVTQKCFFTTTQSMSFTLPAKNPLLQAKGSYYWQVQALSATNSSITYNGSNLTKSGDFRPFSVSETLAIPKFVDSSAVVKPQTAPAGSLLTFSVQLTTELPDGYSVNIDFGDGDLKTMNGSGLDYSYSSTFDTVGENQSFELTIRDKNGDPADTNGNSFTITADGAPIVEPEPVIETPPVVVKPVEPVVKTVPVPSVSTINVSPASIVQGDSLTFSANLSDVLPSGYSVKVDYGNGLFAMNGSGKSYSFNAAPAVSAAYSIGVYDAKNLLKGTKQTGNFSVSAPKPANAAPTLSLISGDKTATVGVPYTIKLSANDSDGNLSGILVSNWGDGASDAPQTHPITHIFHVA
jgi:hypothetical protein